MRELKQNGWDLLHAFWIALDLKKLAICLTALVFVLIGLEAILFVVSVSLPRGYHQYRGPKKPAAAREKVVRKHVKTDGKTPARLRLTREEIAATRKEARKAEEKALWSDKAVHLWEFGKIAAFFEYLWGEGHATILLAILAMMALWKVFVFSYYGGAVFRIAAVEFATEERIALSEAKTFAREKYKSFFWSPGAVVIGIVLFSLFNALGGLIGQIPWIGPVFVGGLFWIALLFGFVVTLLLVGLILGGGLMFSTIAVESSDNFDGVSRALNYLYTRPWKFIWYNIISVVFGALCIAVVAGFAFLIYKVTTFTVRIGLDDATFASLTGLAHQIPTALTSRNLDIEVLRGSMNVGSVLYAVMVCGYFGFVVAYVVSYFISSETILYYLLRKDVDGTEMTEVYLEEEGEEAFDFTSGFETKGGEAGDAQKKGEEKPEEAGKPEEAKGDQKKD